MKTLLVSTVVILPGGTPTVPVARTVANATLVFSEVGINVIHKVRPPITANFLANLRVGRCSFDALTPEQETLFSLRQGMADNEIAVYLVHSTIAVFFGCSRHPPNVPGAALAGTATPWTLAHEICHVMELSHSRARNALMSESTADIVGTPTLSSREAAALLKSPWLVDGET